MKDYRLMVLEIEKCGKSKILHEVDCSEKEALNYNTRLNKKLMPMNHVVVAIPSENFGGIR